MLVSQNARPSGTPGAQTEKHTHNHPTHNTKDVPFQDEKPSGKGQTPHQGPPHQGPPRGFSQQTQFPYGHPSQSNQRFNPYGPPQGYPPHGFPGMQYGPPPPGWYPPPGQGFPHQGYGGMQGTGQPFASEMHQVPGSQSYGQRGPPPQSVTGAGQIAVQDSQNHVSGEKPTAMVNLPGTAANSGQIPPSQNAPPPPTESKPDVAEALAAPASVVAPPGAKSSIPAASKSGRIMPAIPIMSPAQKPKAPVNGSAPPNVAHAAPKPTDSAPVHVSAVSPEDANADARAAVKAAMAKLPPKKQNNGDGSAMDNLTKKVNEMRTNESVRNGRQSGTGSYATGNRGGRGGSRGGRPRTTPQTQKIELPKEDYDFASANAKFNKQDLVKEALAGDSPAIGSPIEGSTSNGDGANGSRRVSDTSAIIASAPSYNKTSSFFDNISSESKDREDPAEKRVGGREFRSEERTKNFETFGQGSVDNGYRGGYRGRGRGRSGFRGGRGSRGARGGGIGGRGGPVAAEG